MGAANSRNRRNDPAFVALLEDDPRPADAHCSTVANAFRDPPIDGCAQSTAATGRRAVRGRHIVSVRHDMKSKRDDGASDEYAASDEAMRSSGSHFGLTG
jgi:hypothetical protein